MPGGWRGWWTAAEVYAYIYIHVLQSVYRVYSQAIRYANIREVSDLESVISDLGPLYDNDQRGLSRHSLLSCPTLWFRSPEFRASIIHLPWGFTIPDLVYPGNSRVRKATGRRRHMI